jgi:hypothetical protein
MDTGGHFPGADMTGVGNEADHSLQSNAEVKNDRSCTSTLPDAFMICTSKTCDLIN